MFGVTLLGYFLADAIGNSIDTYLLPMIFVIIVVSLIPPFVEYRKAKRHGVGRVSVAQAAAEAARLQAEIDEHRFRQTQRCWWSAGVGADEAEDLDVAGGVVEHEFDEEW